VKDGIVVELPLDVDVDGELISSSTHLAASDARRVVE
tara:strand:- start:1722 stop:1832 length:111 start_codon:yes stop_codon:yes gene_type:complete